MFYKLILYLKIIKLYCEQLRVTLRHYGERQSKRFHYHFAGDLSW